MFKFNINLWSGNKLKFAFSLKPFAMKASFAYPEFRLKDDLSTVGRTIGFCFVKPNWNMTHTKCSNGTVLPISCIVQNQLKNFGIAVHNILRGECTLDFSCCAWGISNEEHSVLNALVDARRDIDFRDGVQQRSSDIYISSYSPSECKCCRKMEDLRLGVCFVCSDFVTAEQMIPGVFNMTDTRDGKTWVA